MTTFKRALTDAALNRYQLLLQEDTEPVQFSDSYQHEMDRLIRKANSGRWKLTNTFWKRVVITVAVVLLLVTTAVAYSSGARKAVVRYYPDQNGWNVFYVDHADLERAPKEIETRYAPAWVPERFALKNETLIDHVFRRSYRAENGDRLSYSQNILACVQPSVPSPEMPGFSVSDSGTVMEPFVLNGYEITNVRFDWDDGVWENVYLWTDNTYFYILFADNLTSEEFRDILTSIAPVATP